MFEKPAPADHPILDLLARRWSTRSFADRPVDREMVASLFEAARWAPSSGNGQPWSFLVATKDNPAEHERMASVLVPGNAWAHKAPVLALSVAALDRGDKTNRHAYHDVGLATENLVIQAHSMGLAIHMMAGFNVDMAREVFEIPVRHDPVTMIAIGYPGHPDSLPEDLRKKDLAPRQRKLIREFVFTGKFGQPAALE
ncbi:MAG: Nitroreductase [Bryobacterales bacterium]|nr:Nitroreductase [Bryobacterales bacterium]